ncbi:hypothetical protein N7G274_005356 [Stereocaulon virgatum]|uniref:Uncharacterized protein n=1 Tax=Stereocaulon virgatum TaxID=373712 RepID=A0ABR4AAU0_9LECA
MPCPFNLPDLSSPNCSNASLSMSQFPPPCPVYQSPYISSSPSYPSYSFTSLRLCFRLVIIVIISTTTRKPDDLFSVCKNTRGKEDQMNSLTFAPINVNMQDMILLP